jgi:acylphosphatase
MAWQCDYYYLGVVRRRVLVRGRVQGVWFRQSCADQARQVGAGGWVRNRGDGLVEAVFEGSESAVAAMVGWCHHGPSRAEVSDVTVSSEPEEGLLNFRVIGGD